MHATIYDRELNERAWQAELPLFTYAINIDVVSYADHVKGTPYATFFINAASIHSLTHYANVLPLSTHKIGQPTQS